MKLKVFILSFLFSASMSFAQTKTNDTIQDQVVNVIKPYSPTVADAFKVKEIPKLNDSSTAPKRQVKYTIFSIPVASTFTPAKGKAAGVEKQKRPKQYNNYASLGLGTYSTFLGEVYLSHELDNDQSIGAYLGHHTSLGEIDGVLLDNDFSNTDLHVDFTQNARDLLWKVYAGYDLSSYNWYGLTPELYSMQEIETIDPGHTFNGLMVGGQLEFFDGIFEEASINFRRFTDSYGSGENYFFSDFDFEVPIGNHSLENSLRFDYLNGSFDRDYASNNPLEYGFLTTGLESSYVVTENDLTVNIGLRLVYLNNTENSENKFYIYPNIEASYRLVSDVVIGYGGITGDLLQNTYGDFANDNPFISPTLLIAPTDQQYNFFIGMRGKLSNEVGYNIKGAYSSEDNKALYRLNPALISDQQNYQFGNSFGLVYDEVNTLMIEGALNVDFSRNFTMGLKGAFFSYNTSQQEEAWNLPGVTASLFADYQITEHWYTGLSSFFTGERKDQLLIEGSLSDELQVTKELNSFFDVNVYGGYRINDQFSMFVKVNNLLNQEYQRWINFPVQGIQFLAGASYQFDF